MNADIFSDANMTATVPSIWHYATGTFSLLCLVCGLLTNGLVIFVFIRNKTLRRPRNFFFINLAITDLGLLATNNSMYIVASFKKQWPFGQTGCNFYGMCGGICALTSIASMAAISLTRLAVVIDPFSSLKLTGRFTLKCIACSWIYGSIWIIPSIFDRNRFIFEGFGTSCTFDYISRDLWNRIFILILLVGGFFIPLSIILSSYTFILIKLSERGRRLISRNGNDQQHGSQLILSTVYHFRPTNLLHVERSRSEITTSVELTKDNQIVRNVRRTEARATRTALLVCAVFCIAWGPYAIMVILYQFGFDHFTNGYSTGMLGLFAKTSACINPLIYALSSSAFHQKICFYITFLYKCRGRSSHLSCSNYDLNQRNVTYRSHRQATSSDTSH